jgi:hypothetical protein
MRDAGSRCAQEARDVEKNSVQDANTQKTGIAAAQKTMTGDRLFFFTGNLLTA